MGTNSGATMISKTFLLSAVAFLAASVQSDNSVTTNDNNAVAATWSGSTIQHLWGEYSNIFRHGNRNAASHLWSTFLIENAVTMPLERFNELSGGYCAVSGSPVTPQSRTRYRMTLDSVTGGHVTGLVYYCCWPCVCDTQDFIKIDTKTVVTAEGSSVHNFMVIGNPCKHADKIPWEAPEVRCSEDGELIGAPVSDHGYIILAKFFPDNGEEANDDSVFAGHCEQRKNAGYNSGMGEIFRKVAGITPISLIPAIGHSGSDAEPSGTEEQTNNTEL